MPLSYPMTSFTYVIISPHYPGARIEDHLSIWDVKTGQRYDFEDIQTSLLGNIEWRQHSNQLAIADLDKGVTILKFEFNAQK